MLRLWNCIAEAGCVVPAMRSPKTGLSLLRAATGASEEDPRLIGVQLDLVDPESVEAAAGRILDRVGSPYALVHNAGVAVAGFAEETPASEWQRVFATNVFGPSALTSMVLPAMRSGRRGRIVVVSSTGAIRGMPLASTYSATKAAIERWAEALAAEIAPYGVGVTIMLAGTYDTDITGDATPVFRDENGPYASQHPRIEKRGRLAMRLANPPQRFASALAEALDRDHGPIVHRGAGIDAKMFKIIGRVMPPLVMHHMVRIGLGQPRFGALRDKTEIRRTQGRTIDDR